jgi:preprotein translocase subunit YajC
VKGSERIILVALPLIALAVGFWLLVLAPKQKQAGELQDRIDGLNGRVDAAEVEIAAAETARS